MNDGTFVEKMRDSFAQPQVIKPGIDDGVALPAGWSIKRTDIDSPTPLGVTTLRSLLDYLEANVDLLKLDALTLVIESPVKVSLRGRLNPNERWLRHHYLRAEADVPSFPFGGWIDSDTFILNVQSKFMPTKERDELLKIVSTIRIEQGVTLDDDGVSQKVVTAQGIRLANATVKAAWELIPFRTFAEAEQPESRFVLRMRSDGGGLKLALHEADGGAWRAEAMQAIRKVLEPSGVAILS